MWKQKWLWLLNFLSTLEVLIQYQSGCNIQFMEYRVPPKKQVKLDSIWRSVLMSKFYRSNNLIRQTCQKCALSSSSVSDQGSISSTFDEQRLHLQILKKTDKFTVFFALSGSAGMKAACRTLVKLTPGLNFTNILWAAFTLKDPKSTKNTVKSSVFLRFCNLGT